MGAGVATSGVVATVSLFGARHGLHILSTRLLLVQELEPELGSAGSVSQPRRGCVSWLVT